MQILKISVFLLLAGFFQHAHAQQAPEFVIDVDYRQLKSQQIDTVIDLTQLQQIADIEIFYWYGCQPCQQVELALADYLKLNPELSVRRTPLVAHLDWRPQAYVQPLIEQLQHSGDKNLNLPTFEQIYEICLTDCSVFADFERSKRWLKQRMQMTDLPPIDEAKIWLAEKNYRKRAESFSISQVPTIIIRESYAVDANSAKSLPRMIDIVDYLLQEVTKP